MATEDAWQVQLQSLGSFIRAQRQLADLSLREMGDLAKISNAYLSQVERGLHQPSVRVLRSIATALGVPADVLLAQAGLGTGTATGAAPDPAKKRSTDTTAGSAAEAIQADPALTEDQRRALLAVYRSFVPES
ncbi:MAG: helix-turn-helix domain-containing protein [Frankiaceae bacterium]